jgi:hypothetical protein
MPVFRAVTAPRLACLPGKVLSEMIGIRICHMDGEVSASANKSHYASPGAFTFEPYFRFALPPDSLQPTVQARVSFRFQRRISG